MITAEKQDALRMRMESLGIVEEDLVEKFVLGAGNGGQKINKTHSCVFLRHDPSGIQVKCQEGRSRTANRYQARVLLCDRFEYGTEEQERKEREIVAKERRRNRRRSRAAKARMLDGKRRRSAVKQLRQAPDSGEMVDI
jgi:peptide chain release factor